MLKKLVHLSMIMCLAISYLGAQGVVIKEVKDVNRSTAKAVYLGKSRPLGTLTQKPVTPKEKRDIQKLMKQKPGDFKNRRHVSKAIRPDNQRFGLDLIRQSEFGTRDITPLLNIVGIGDFGSPHDPTGEVGTNHFVQAVNVTYIGVFDKSGTLVSEFAANTLWSEFNKNSAGDPIVLFDEEADRWIITEFTDPANLLIAVSATNDPLGEYNAYNFSTPNFPDYPKYSIWPGAYELTTNENGTGELTHYFLDRQAILSGSNDVTIQRLAVEGHSNIESGFYVAAPVDWNGIAPVDPRPISLALNDSTWGDVDTDQVEMYRFDIDWENADSTKIEKLSLNLSPYDSYPCILNPFYFECVPQKGGQALDAIPENIMNLSHYRNFGSHESIVFTFITDVEDGNNHSGIRWTELRRTSTQDWHVYQEGTYAPDDGLHRFMPSIDIDKDGNIGMGFNVTSADTYVGVRFTGRLANDELGKMTVKEFNVVDGVNTINSSSRFGDYAHISVDPTNGNDFYYTTEYAGTGESVTQTRIVAFRMQKDSFDLAVKAIYEPILDNSFTNSEAVKIEVVNQGLYPISEYNIGFSLDGVQMETIPITDTIAPDSIKRFAFTQTADLAALGTYTLKAWVKSIQDTGIGNDTFKLVVNHIPALEANMVKLTSTVLNCSDSNVMSFEVKNEGFDTIHQLDVEWTVNNTIADTISVDAAIANGTSATLERIFTALGEGTQIIVAKIVGINGQTTFETTKPSATFTLKNLSAEGNYTLTLKTDKYQSETSWTLIDLSTGRLLKSEEFTEPNTVYNTPLCLEKDHCYAFTIYDSYGDGICCSEGSGYYFITNADGVKIVDKDGKFGNDERTEFCAKPVCILTASVDVSDEHGGNADGSILITAMASTPVKYSIDGGLTYSENPLFTGLTQGIYNIKVVNLSDTTCFFTTQVEVKLVESTNAIENNVITLNPNPNNGYFHVDAKLAANDNAVKMQLIDATGKVLQERMVTKYNDSYKTAFSMLNEPTGIYFLRIVSKQKSMMQKFVKQ